MPNYINYKGNLLEHFAPTPSSLPPLEGMALVTLSKYYTALREFSSNITDFANKMSELQFREFSNGGLYIKKVSGTDPNTIFKYQDSSMSVSRDIVPSTNLSFNDFNGVKEYTYDGIKYFIIADNAKNFVLRIPSENTNADVLTRIKPHVSKQNYNIFLSSTDMFTPESLLIAKEKGIKEADDLRKAAEEDALRYPTQGPQSTVFTQSSKPIQKLMKYYEALNYLKDKTINFKITKIELNSTRIKIFTDDSLKYRNNKTLGTGNTFFVKDGNHNSGVNYRMTGFDSSSIPIPGTTPVAYTNTNYCSIEMVGISISDGELDKIAGANNNSYQIICENYSLDNFKKYIDNFSNYQSITFYNNSIAFNTPSYDDENQSLGTQYQTFNKLSLMSLKLTGYYIALDYLKNNTKNFSIIKLNFQENKIILHTSSTDLLIYNNDKFIKNRFFARYETFEEGINYNIISTFSPEGGIYTISMVDIPMNNDELFTISDINNNSLDIICSNNELDNFKNYIDKYKLSYPDVKVDNGYKTTLKLEPNPSDAIYNQMDVNTLNTVYLDSTKKYNIIASNIAPTGGDVSKWGGITPNPTFRWTANGVNSTTNVPNAYFTSDKLGKVEIKLIVAGTLSSITINIIPIPPLIYTVRSPEITQASTQVSSAINNMLDVSLNTPASSKQLLDRFSSLTSGQQVSVTIPLPDTLVKAFTDENIYPVINELITNNPTIPMVMSTTTTNTDGNQVIDSSLIPKNSNPVDPVILIVPSLEPGVTLIIDSLKIVRGNGTNGGSSTQISVNNGFTWDEIGKNIRLDDGKTIKLSGIGSPVIFTIYDREYDNPITILDYLFMHSYFFASVGAIFFSVNSFIFVDLPSIFVNKYISLANNIFITVCGFIAVCVWFRIDLNYIISKNIFNQKVIITYI